MRMKVGEVYNIYFNENNRNNKQIIILALVEDHVVYKYFSNQGKRIIVVKSIHYLQALRERGYISVEVT